MRFVWKLGAVLLVVLVGLVGVGVVTEKVPWLHLFGEESVDRTGPSVLQSLVDLSEFHAASAHYETVVDIERDTNLLPGWVSGERLLYVGKGNVDAVVDFSELDERRLVLGADGSSVTVRLPAPTVGQPVLDIENSYVVNHDQGLATKFGGSDLEHEAQLKAIDQMTTAATAEGTLMDLAKQNTTSMLRGLLGALGHTDVTVTFDPS